MKIKLLLLIPFLFFMKSSSDEAVFWGKNGHRATGEIAEKHLTRKAKRSIDKILKGQSLAFVATYADEIKSDKKYNKYYSWHYINMDLDQTYEQAEKNPKGDLVTGINTCIEILNDKNSSDDEKNFHLKMLVHFMGDLHQPMHIGRKEDKGGNSIQVEWFGKGSNLHRVWDTNMIDDWEMSYIELADNADDLSKIQIETIEKGTLIDWVNEVHIVTNEVYNSVEKGENLRYKYSYNHFGTLRTQLQKGGIRLAKVLNDIFD
jgi:hypothetical protein